MTTFSFPGFGIGETTIDPVAFSFSLFGKEFEIRWYGLIICIGMLLAVLYVLMRAKKQGISAEDVLDLALIIIPCGIVGARLYYVIMKLDTYIFTGGVWYENVWYTLKNMVSIWNGGLAIYGGIIAGGLALWLVARKKKLNVFTVLDMVAPAVMIGQILGRWGNFFNGEAHGTETDIFCRMGLMENGEMVYVHPTFLYESLWNLIGFGISNLLYRKKKFEGEVFFFYIAWYGFGRMFIEGLRTDSLFLGPWRISQLVGFACFIIGTICFVLFMRKAKQDKETEEIEYAGVYAKLRRHTKVEKTAEELEEEAKEDEILSRIIKKDDADEETDEETDEE